MGKRYLTAKEAAEALRVTLPTLYAYVSRGLIRSEAAAEGKRQRRYYAEDIEKLLARKEGRQHPEKLAQDALHWGAPLMDSAITLIDEGKLYYRGQDVAQLVTTASVEQVAALIWADEMRRAGQLFALDVRISAQRYEMMLLHMEMDGAALSPLQALQTFLPVAAADDHSAYDVRPAAVAHTGARILRLMASVTAGDVPENMPIAAMLQRGWCPAYEDAAHLLNAALILVADHELNASSFVARVVASAGATPYAVVLGGLAALQGSKHGGHTERVGALLREAQSAADIHDVMAGRLRRGESIPGFGHKLYPDGDPRARILLNMIQDTLPDSAALSFALTAIDAAQELIGEAPTIDFLLVILARILHLPAGSPITLFALGRTIGWVGHAIEQYDEDRLIRPRARYVGVLPED